MIAALDAATGRPLWTRTLPSSPFGCATVASDVLFAPTYDGRIYALSARTGESSGATARRPGSTAVPPWQGTRCSCPRAHLIVGLFAQPAPELIAYRLSGAGA